MTEAEFKSAVCKREGKGRKKFKVSGSWGVYDAYKLIRKNGWYDIGRPLTEHEFYTIIRSVNNLIARQIALGKDFTMPERMGKLELRKREAEAKIVDGKLKITYPVDWQKTLNLWYEDEEAREQKTLLRDMNGTVYKVKYNKYNANYNNRMFYKFHLNRKIK